MFEIESEPVSFLVYLKPQCNVILLEMQGRYISHNKNKKRKQQTNNAWLLESSNEFSLTFQFLFFRVSKYLVLLDSSQHSFRDPFSSSSQKIIWQVMVCIYFLWALDPLILSSGLEIVFI